MARRRPLRRITVDGHVYLYAVEHQHREEAPARACAEIFTAYREGDKRAPLRIVFRESGPRQAGYPEAGVVWVFQKEPPTPDRPQLQLNLNTPGVAAALVRGALSLGWDPSGPRPYIVENGFEVFLPHA